MPDLCARWTRVNSSAARPGHAALGEPPGEPLGEPAPGVLVQEAAADSRKTRRAHEALLSWKHKDRPLSVRVHGALKGPNHRPAKFQYCRSSSIAGRCPLVDSNSHKDPNYIANNPWQAQQTEVVGKRRMGQ